jgi:hypothetical protein
MYNLNVINKYGKQIIAIMIIIIIIIKKYGGLRATHILRTSGRVFLYYRFIVDFGPLIFYGLQAVYPQASSQCLFAIGFNRTKKNL